MALLDCPTPEQITGPSHFSSRQRNKTTLVLHFSALECTDWSPSAPYSAPNFRHAVTTSGVELSYHSQVPCRQHQPIYFSLSVSVTDSGQRWQYGYLPEFISVGVLLVVVWTLLRKSLIATWKQGQGPYNCPLSMLRSGVFPKLLSVLFSHSSNITSLSYLPTTAFFIHPFQGCLHFWSYCDMIFLVAWGLEVAEFPPLMSRAVPQVCERTRFLSCRVMSAAPERTLGRVLYPLHSALGEEPMLPDAPGCSAFCCCQQWGSYGLSCVLHQLPASCHLLSPLAYECDLLVEFSAFEFGRSLRALWSNGLIWRCWWDSGYGWDQVEKSIHCYEEPCP